MKNIFVALTVSMLVGATVAYGAPKKHHPRDLCNGENFDHKWDFCVKRTIEEADKFEGNMGTGYIFEKVKECLFEGE